MPPLAPIHESISYNSDHSCPPHKNKKASVCFRLDQNQVQLVPMASEMTPKEIAASYYTSNDLKKMKSSHHVLLRMKRSGRWNAKSEDYCLRGVEDDARKEQRNLRNNKLKAILFERMVHQQQQLVDGVRDPDEIAEKLAQESRASIEEAIARAQSDAVEAASTNEDVSQSLLRLEQTHQCVVPSITTRSILRVFL